MHGLAWYAFGVATAFVAGATGGSVGKRLRPAAKTVVKSGMIASREVQRRLEETRATFDDLVAEAGAELDRGNNHQGEAAER